MSRGRTISSGALGAITPALALAALAAAAPLGAQAVPASRPTTPPPAGPIRPWQFPAVRSFTLDNGLQVHLVERRALPMVSMRAIVDAGSLREPAAQNGLAALTGSLLDEGTSAMTGAQIARRMEELGAQFGTSASYSLASADLTALKPVFPQALGVLAQTLIEPSFPESEFARVKAEQIAAYEQRNARAEALASDAFFRAAFQESAPFSRPPQGTRESLTPLTRDDVVRWHHTMYAPSSTTLLLVGDLTLDEARRMVQDAFGGWKKSRADLPAPVNPVRTASGTRVVLIDRPGSVQSGLVVGRAGLMATDPEYLSLVAANHVLGGAVSSRLNNNLREKHGWTYGAFSGLDLRRAGGAITLSSAVRTDATDSAVVEALAEYRRLLAEPVPAAEFTGAVNNLVASFPTSVQTVQALQGRLQNLILWGLPLDYYATYRERLAALTPAEVQQAVQRKLSAEDVIVVVAGDLSKIEQPLRARNVGTIEVWDAMGRKLR